MAKIHLEEFDSALENRVGKSKKRLRAKEEKKKKLPKHQKKE